MSLASAIDTALDRSIVLGYGRQGLGIRRRLSSWPEDPPRMDGKVVLVTGAGSGLGLAAAAGFARLGASVRALGRDEGRAEQAAEAARARAGAGADVRPVACDVADLQSLRSFIEGFLAREDRLDVLVNNAGVMPGEREHTRDGVELTFATHVVGPWVLIDGLAPLLERSAPARVVNVSSGGQYDQKIPEGDLQSEQDSYGPKKIYARTKREQLAITEQWAERLAPRGIHVHGMHPGWADTKGVRNWMPVFRALTRFVIRSPEQGADTIVWLGGAPEAIATTGLFWADRRPRPMTYTVGAGPDKAATRQALWDEVASIAGRP
jgi:NAD(P)-dependent dehydrogenase (short-subunit alcohol dehydrogenase family)